MKPVPCLTSKDNPLLKKIRRLTTGPHNVPDNPVVAEGTRVLEEVIQSGCTTEAVVIAESFGSDPREHALYEKWMARKIRLFQVKDRLFESLSRLKTPQGAIALVKVPEAHFPATQDPKALILFACGIQDPGNLGTLIRTAAAAGATMICTSLGTVSARNPKVIRSSAGAFFHLIPVEHIDVNEFLDYCRIHCIQPYRTDIQKGSPHTESDLRRPCSILLGNEGSGMNRDELSELPSIRIPMANRIESLNVALAGAVILFEASRQRYQPVVKK